MWPVTGLGRCRQSWDFVARCLIPVGLGIFREVFDWLYRTGLPAFGHQDGRRRHGTPSPIMNWSLPIGLRLLYWTKSKIGLLKYDYKTFTLELITPRRAQLLRCLISRLGENFEAQRMAVNVASLPPLPATASTLGSKSRDCLRPARLPCHPYSPDHPCDLCSHTTYITATTNWTFWYFNNTNKSRAGSVWPSWLT